MQKGFSKKILKWHRKTPMLEIFFGKVESLNSICSLILTLRRVLQCVSHIVIIQTKYVYNL